MALGHTFALVACSRLALWQLADERNLQIVDVLATTHYGSHRLTQVNVSQWKSQTNEEGHQQNHLAARTCGTLAAHRWSDDTGIVGRECLRELVLLALLQQVEVQLLLHLLLTFYRKQILLTSGVRSHLCITLGLGATCRTDLRIECGDLVIDASDEVVAHLGQLLVEVEHHRVVHTRVGYQAIALQLLGIVGADQILDCTVLHTAVGGQQLVLVGITAHILAQILGHIQLVAELYGLLRSLVGLCHVHLVGGLHVGDEVLRLILRDVSIYITQLLFDDCQTIVDEL